MKSKLLIGVLGNLRSGKTQTWSTLFNREVRTGKHPRIVNIFDEKIPVFLINGSPLERRVDLQYIMPKNDPAIVLCSFLYHKKVKENFNFFIEKDYELFIHWLNPGYNDESDKVLFYNIGIINYLLANGATVGVKNAKTDCIERVDEIKAYIYAWNKIRQAYSNNIVE